MCHSKLVTMKHFVSSQSQCIEHVQKLHVHWFDGYGYWPCAVPIEGKDRYSWMHCSIHGREIKPWCKFFALCGGQQTNLLCHSPNFFVFQTYGYSLRIHRFTNMSIIYVHLTNMSVISYKQRLFQIPESFQFLWFRELLTWWCFARCLQIDHWKKDYKFGFGMTVGDWL